MISESTVRDYAVASFMDLIILAGVVPIKSHSNINYILKEVRGLSQIITG